MWWEEAKINSLILVFLLSIDLFFYLNRDNLYLKFIEQSFSEKKQRFEAVTSENILSLMG